MTSDSRRGLDAEPPEGAGPTDPQADIDDTEGHSLSMVLGISALGRGTSRERSRRPADEELKPITKPFPRLRDGERR